MTRPGMITREAEPCNLEFPFCTLEGRLTPPGQHYVRSHFAAPDLDPRAWRLTVDGEVERPLSLSLDELRAMPSRTVTVTMECAGNGRVFLTPKVRGVAWELGAVGTAAWTGVPLPAVLERVGVRSGAREVVLESADSGRLTEPVATPGTIPYARSLPLDKALGDVLLAYAVNGEALPQRHGFPLRAVVPGWYGMAAVKWLAALRVTAPPFAGYFQTVDYATWERQGELPPQLVPLAQMQVKAQVARPSPHEALALGRPYRISGAAWTGEGTVTRVEVSTDSGEAWQDAGFLDPPEPHVWRRWHLSWTPQIPGNTTVLARATDSRGQMQPSTHDPGRGGYMVNFPLPIPVTVLPQDTVQPQDEVP